MPTPNCRLFFIYGTLLPGQCRARFIAALSARSLGAATTFGWLLHLGDYPGLVTQGWWECRGMSPPPAAEISPLVHGQLIEVPDLARASAILDDEEGCLAADLGLDAQGQPVPGDIAFGHGLYVRQLVPVSLSNGTDLWAWTYVYNQPVSDSRCIPSGDWLNVDLAPPRETRE
jgi:gamma-glutamylcyclotransferase (GGCT)/AIG2-like uncharacterized protein YtfP